MALLFMDSFDHYATADQTTKWTETSGAISAGNGRRASSSLRLSSGVGRVSKVLVTSGATAMAGVAFRLTNALTSLIIMGFYSGSANLDHVRVVLNSDGSLSVARPNSGGIAGGTNIVLGTTALGLIATGVYNYIELKVLLHASAGTVLLRVNGATLLNLTGQITTGGTLTWDRVYLNCSTGGSPTVDFDDFYVLDGSGAAPWNDLLGDCRVDARFPTAAGATTGWTPSTGANWSCVDDATPNGDTDYVSAASAPLTDTYTVQDSPVVGATIYGIQHCLSLTKTDAGLATIAPVIRHSGVDYPGTGVNIGTSYGGLFQISPTNPGTSAQWTEAHFNAAEFGIKRTA